MEASKLGKRKKEGCTLEKKLNIIGDLKNGKSQRLLASDFEIPKSIIADIWKDREKIESHVSASDNPSLSKMRCIVREAQHEKLDRACYIWFMQQRS